MCIRDRYKEARKAYMIHLGRIMDLAKAGKDKEAWAILWSDEYNATVNIGLQTIDRMEELKVAQAKEAIVSNEALANASTRQMIVAMVVSLVLAIGGGILLTSFLARPLDGYARFMNLSADMFCIAGFDRFFKSVNPSWEEALGFTSQELMAKPYTEFIHPDDREDTIAEASRIQAPEDTCIAFENRYICKDGSYRWLSWNAVSVPDQKLTYAVARDITRRRQVEEALRKSEEHLRLLVDGVSDYAIFMLDPSGQVASWNQGAERIKGYKANEIIGRHFSCFYPPEELQNGKPERELQKAIAEGHYAEEGWRIRKDGSRFWAHVEITALRDNTGKLRGFSKVTRDVTEQRRAEELLRESEQRLTLASTSGEVGVWDLDLIADQAWRSLQHDRIFGYESLLPNWGAAVFSDHVFPEDRELVKQRFEEAFQNGHLEFECRIIRADQAMRWISSKGEVVRNEQGQPIRMMGVVTDVTERKRAEEEKRKFMDRLAASNQELELRNREVERVTKLKSKFLASMSHELRTPLNAIVGFSDLLAEGTPGDLNDKQKRFVNHIKQGSAHLLQLINDILDLSKIEAGQLDLRCEDFQIKTALPEVLSTIRSLAVAKNIQIEQKMESDQHVYADRVRFKQILYLSLIHILPDHGHGNFRLFATLNSLDANSSDILRQTPIFKTGQVGPHNRRYRPTSSVTSVISSF